MGYLEAGMRWILEFLYSGTHNYGVAVILLTVAIRFLLWPLMTPQFRSALAMREIQPKLKAIQEKYGDNQEELQKRTMQVYKEHGVNPFAGCLPLLVQLPFMWALWRMLASYPFSGGFLWLSSLTHADPYYILPILSGVTTWLQSWLGGAASDPTSKSMTVVMPLVLTWITTTLPAGVSIYWVTSNLFGIGQQWAVTRSFLKRRRAGQEGGRARA
ncbi:MAG: membrane protein insertase YidC [Limnochordaceae bacterium]|nr:membrane protein insertase YidC [Limnochordaceae bacterium]